MAFDQRHDFIDDADEALARQEARRVTLVGLGVAFILGIVLVSVLMYGRILTDDAGIVSTSPAALVASGVPKPNTP